MNLAVPRRELPENAGSGISGVLPLLGHLSPGYQPSVLKLTLGEDIYHINQYTATAPLLMLMGTTRCWSYNGAAATERTPGVPFVNLPPIWGSTTLLHNGAPVFVSNNFGENYPYYWDGVGGTMVVVANAPQMRTFCGWQGRLWGGNIFDPVGGVWLVNRMEWSGVGDITDWAGISWGLLDLTDDNDPIYRLEKTSGEILCIFRRRSIYVGLPNAIVTNPVGERFLTNRGVYAPNSLQRSGDDFFYMGDDDVYRFNVNEKSVSIGRPIRKELFRLLDHSKVLYVWSFHDSSNKLYYLVTKLTDATFRAWIYNYEQECWAIQAFANYIALGEWYA